MKSVHMYLLAIVWLAGTAQVHAALWEDVKLLSLGWLSKLRQNLGTHGGKTQQMRYWLHESWTLLTQVSCKRGWRAVQDLHSWLWPSCLVLVWRCQSVVADSSQLIREKADFLWTHWLFYISCLFIYLFLNGHHILKTSDKMRVLKIRCQKNKAQKAQIVCHLGCYWFLSARPLVMFHSCLCPFILGCI